MITFEKRAVAFIDLLGFTKMVEAAEGRAEALAELQKVVDLLGKAVPGLNSSVDAKVPVKAIPEHTYISDSIILSAPLAATDEDGRQYDGLSSVVMRCIQINHLVLRSGYLLGGGITIGSCWHNGANIIGSAYMDAYKLEQASHQPRIQLSKEAFDHWNQAEADLNKRIGIGLPPNYMVRVYQDVPMVNGLHEHYIENRETHGALEDTYKAYDATIKKRVGELGGSAKEKWEWFQRYFNDEAKRAANWIAEDRVNR